MNADSDKISAPRHQVKHIRNVRIPVRDGTRLAADLFVPDLIAGLVEGDPSPLPLGEAARRAGEGSANVVPPRSGASWPSPHPSPLPAGEGTSFPALLEYLPYRKDDNTAPRWDAHDYFAARGYVGVRLDVRGTGDSPGIAEDEYTLQEQLDGYDAIEWLAAQPWCNGRVGMFGTSYGGFNAIQVAMHNPPGLKAIVPHAATDDRFNDDMHFNGGCLTALDQLPYPLRMISMNALPPTPELAGDDWEQIWKQHLDNPPWMLEWLRRQVNDRYWQHGSLRTDYGAIRCPVFHIGAWNDAYTNAVFRMLEHLQVPNKALVGPWTHSRPNVCVVGPRVDHLHEMLRWWDYWLKDVNTGVLDEPRITLYVQHSHPPERFPRHIPGEWRYENEWPPGRTETMTLHLGSNGRLVADSPLPLGEAAPRAGEGSPDGSATRHAYPSPLPQGEGMDSFIYDPTMGTTVGFWCPSEPPAGLAGDQRPDDARSLTYETAPLAEPLEILGTPRVVLHASSTAPVAFFCARLCDMAPDGASTLITRGALNATRRRSQLHPEPLAPGDVYELMVDLRVISWVVPAGHRLCLSVTSAEWPLLWPSPYPATNAVHYGGGRASRLELPIVGPPDPPLPEPRLLKPAPTAKTAKTQSGHSYWQTVRDELTGAVTVRHGRQGTVSPLIAADDPYGGSIAVHSQSDVEASVAPARPESACVKGTVRWVIEQSGLPTEVTSRACIQSTVDALHVDIELNVTRAGSPFWHRQWQESIPRNLL